MSRRVENATTQASDNIDGGKSGGASVEGRMSVAESSNWTVSSDDFIQLQMDREKEFLEYICEPLEALVASAASATGAISDDENAAEATTAAAAQIAQTVVDEVADQLRSKVNASLRGFEPSSLEDFDNRLVEILQSVELITDIETVRDGLLTQILESHDQKLQEEEAEQEQAVQQQEEEDIAAPSTNTIAEAAAEYPGNPPDVTSVDVAHLAAEQQQHHLDEEFHELNQHHYEEYHHPLKENDGGGGDGTDDNDGGDEHTGGDNSTVTTNDTYANVQKDRESEFLQLLCEPLHVLAPEVQEVIIQHLALALREKVSFLLT